MAHCLILIGCGALKAESATEAKNLYIGPLFTDRRQYAESSGATGWYILSGLHGLLEPEQVLAPYDFDLRRETLFRRRLWGRDVLEQLEQRLPKSHWDKWRVEIHAGAPYAEALLHAYHQQAIRFVSLRWPVKGLSQGAQRAFYQQQRLSASLGRRPIAE